MEELNEQLVLMWKLAFILLIMAVSCGYATYSINQRIAKLAVLIEVQQLELDKVELQIEIIQLHKKMIQLELDQYKE